MIWALVGIIVLVVIVALVCAFLMLQSVSQTLSNALSTIERVHTNDGKRIDQVLDRLMAMDFESFKNYQLAEDAEAGGIELPEEPAEVRLELPGVSQALGYDRLRRAEEEARIIAEDFPPEEAYEA